MGGDSVLATGYTECLNFNSHPRVGGDQLLNSVGGIHTISIRTPAWGVTAGRGQRETVSNFNSHPRMGG